MRFIKKSPSLKLGESKNTALLDRDVVSPTHIKLWWEINFYHHDFTFVLST